MIRFLARVLGLFLIAGALVALVVDAAKSIAASTLVVTALGEAWYAASANTQVAVQQGIEARFGHWVWDPLMLSILILPTWVVLGALGFLLTYLGRRRLTGVYA